MSQLCFLLSILCASAYCSTSGDYNTLFNRWGPKRHEEEDRDSEINYEKIDWASASSGSDNVEQIPFAIPSYVQIHDSKPAK
ncbi:hypothetical protein DSO57_1028323 [Entomophthora muscae]|uniref:Uncharacterized protein n=1 Tax=Entomophthora muscae TaxID=34485 RepID=A0ACC2SQU6_9FUNG|nr:hypothetical protein DSO57_1028323 [Entomophthora muscae]